MSVLSGGSLPGVPGVGTLGITRRGVCKRDKNGIKRSRVVFSFLRGQSSDQDELKSKNQQLFLGGGGATEQSKMK